MIATPQWNFPPFRLDPRNACLWQDDMAIPLSPKLFGVLQCLVQHAAQLVSKDTLFATVWPETAVSEAVLKVAIQALRRVLGDTARAPQYIATVHGHGYRFIAPVTLLQTLSPPAAVLPGAAAAAVFLPQHGDTRPTCQCACHSVYPAH